LILKKKLLPDSFANFFIHNRDIHPLRVTRQSNQIYIPRPRNNFIANLPANTIPCIWNTWTGAINIDITNNKIKKQIKIKLTQQYLEDVKCDNMFCRQCYTQK